VKTSQFGKKSNQSHHHPIISIRSSVPTRATHLPETFFQSTTAQKKKTSNGGRKLRNADFSYSFHLAYLAYLPLYTV
jgi:hypothetical protein